MLASSDTLCTVPSFGCVCLGNLVMLCGDRNYSYAKVLLPKVYRRIRAFLTRRATVPFDIRSLDGVRRANGPIHTYLGMYRALS
jgi:hypothetical protein